MAKTLFVDNVTRVLAAFANSIFGQGAAGGHVHDGVDADGHCGKVQACDIAGLIWETHTQTVHIEDTISANPCDLIFQFDYDQTNCIIVSASLRNTTGGGAGMQTGPYYVSPTEYMFVNFYFNGSNWVVRVNMGSYTFNYYTGGKVMIILQKIQANPPY